MCWKRTNCVKHQKIANRCNGTGTRCCWDSLHTPLPPPNAGYSEADGKTCLESIIHTCAVAVWARVWEQWAVRAGPASSLSPVPVPVPLLSGQTSARQPASWVGWGMEGGPASQSWQQWVCIDFALIASQLTPGLHVKPAAGTYMCSLHIHRYILLDHLFRFRFPIWDY